LQNRKEEQDKTESEQELKDRMKKKKKIIILSETTCLGKPRAN